MKTLTDELAGILLEWIPTYLKQYEEAGRETVQTVVWLVGLASGLVTLIAVNPKIVDTLTNGSRRALVIALAATITCGVLQRIIYQIAEQKQRVLFPGLQGYLTGYTVQVQEPDEFDETWDRREIVQRLARNFDVDYSLLEKFDIPIERYREAYSRQLELWHKHGSENLQRLGEITAAYLGISETDAKKIFDPNQERSDNLAEVRSKVRRIHYLQRATLILFIGTCASFLGALLILAIAILP
jgi:hypothetical protein